MKKHELNYIPDKKWRFVDGYRRAHYFDGDRSLCGAHDRPEPSFVCLNPDDTGCKKCWEKRINLI